eukprot:96748-Alexandrium_andersonii.AAC.1
MSASLVGSEMCIRDRHVALHVFGCQRSFMLEALREEEHVGRACLRVTWTVSYTHLTLPTICSV